jgi:hypothetical protein
LVRLLKLLPSIDIAEPLNRQIAASKRQLDMTI